ncbi:unnamed protein product [Staurois parvus]|uniref:Secreted protein n=1 Tax=Staurois parvus TaxID=386267 RepID=A0ABN9CEA5_9NEOB|nr:unnamed protein product [Staurois parvus]
MYIYLLLQFQVGGARHSWPWLSITGSCPVIPRLHPVITEYLRQGRDLCINNTSLPCQLLHTALYGCA